MANDPDRTPLLDLSPRWQYSLKQLLLWTAIIALFCLALKGASPVWAAAVFALALVLLTAAGLLAVFRRGRTRAYWIGFAACGWLYLAVVVYGSALEVNTIGTNYSNPLRADNLATSQLSTWLYQKVHPWIAWPEEQSHGAAYYGGGGMGGMGDPATGTAFTYPGLTVVGNRGPYQHDFVNVAHALWTLLLATCGGAFARWLYLTGPGKDERGGAGTPA